MEARAGSARPLALLCALAVKEGRPPADAQVMEDMLAALRWHKYGKDRLYISTRVGARVGWLDLVSGQSTLEQWHLAGAFRATVDGLSAPRTASKHRPTRCRCFPRPAPR